LTAPQRYPIDPAAFGPDPLPGLTPGESGLTCDLGNVRFSIAKATVALIEQTVQEKFMAVRYGAEAAGLLIGRISEDRKDIAIERIVEIASEYRYGPFLRLSPQDLGTFKQTLAELSESGAQIVGLYRSQTRGESGLRDTDEEVLKTIAVADTAYAQNFKLILLFAPSVTTAPALEVLTHTGAGWEIVARRRFAAADPRSTPVSPPPAKAAATRPPAPPAPEAPPAPQTEAPPARPLQRPASTSVPRARRSWLPVVALATLLGSAAIGWWVASRTPSTPRVVPTPSVTARERLGFAAAKENGDWKLSWSPDAAARLAQNGADLVIRDAGNERQTALTGEDLATGTLFYTPRSSDIVFILRAKAAGRPDVEERIRVIGSLPPPSQKMEQGTLRLRPVAPPIQLSEAKPPAPDHRAFVPPQAQPDKPAASNPISLPAPPQLAKTEPSERPPILSAPIASPAPPPIAAPAGSPSAAPASSAPKQAVGETVGVPPVAIHQEQPHWPRFAPHTGLFEVEIRVQVDAAGEVVRATPVQRSTATAPFVDSAIQAVRFWKFRPAQAGGHAVPGEVVLSFRFKQ
jgi:protein TonB